MQGEPAPAAGVEHARAIRAKAGELGVLLGLPDGTPWIVELTYGPSGYLNLRRHQGPLKSDDDLLAIARAVGLIE
jgi:hypothetical protein